MFAKKQIYFLIAIAAILSLALAQQQVFAQWTGPTQGPSGGSANPPITNPMTGDFDLYGWDINNSSTTDSGLNVDTINATSGTFSGNLNVNTIDGHTVAEFLSGGGGGIENPLKENLSGDNKFSVEELKSCSPKDDGDICAALEATGNKNIGEKSYSVGVYGKTIADSGVNPSYGVYGLADNEGGVGVIGQTTRGDGSHYSVGVYGSSATRFGYGGYFTNSDSEGLALVVDGKAQITGATGISGDTSITGKLKATGRLVVGNYATQPATPANSGGVLELGRYDWQNTPHSSFIYTGPISQGHDGIFFDASATGNGDEVVISDVGQVAIGGGTSVDSDTTTRLLVKGKTNLIGAPGLDDGILEAGNGASADTRGGVAIGQSSSVTGDFSTAIGYGTDVSGFRSMAIGNSINVSGNYSLGLGLDGVSRDVSADNVLSIMGGKIGINVLDPLWDVEVDGVIFAKSTTTSPIIGWGFSGTDYANAGVEGIGNIGVYAFGNTVGLYADGSYGTITRGTVPGTIDPPDDPDDPGNLPGSHGYITKLFGIEKTMADASTPASLGSVALGGYSGGASLSSAGLGICALSGETAWTLDRANDYDYFTYCQDGSGTNNYAGFFAGDVYLKNGTLQIHGSLAASNENLIYANAASAASGSNVIKLQVGGSTKFSVDKDGNTYVPGNLTLQYGLLDFNASDSASPSCTAGKEGSVFYFGANDALCICDGSSWKSIINDKDDNGYCTNGTYTPK
jgi:hypothetical protein